MKDSICYNYIEIVDDLEDFLGYGYVLRFYYE